MAYCHNCKHCIEYEHDDCDEKDIRNSKEERSHSYFETLVPAHQSERAEDSESFHNFEFLNAWSQADVRKHQYEKFKNIPNYPQVTRGSIKDKPIYNYLRNTFCSEYSNGDKIYPIQSLFKLGIRIKQGRTEGKIN